MKVIRADVYVAADGKQFVDEGECQEWELACKIRCVIEEWTVLNDRDMELTDSEVITALMEVL